MKYNRIVVVQTNGTKFRFINNHIGPKFNVTCTGCMRGVEVYPFEIPDIYPLNTKIIFMCKVCQQSIHDYYVMIEENDSF